MFDFLKRFTQNATAGGKASLQSMFYMFEYPQFFIYPLIHICALIAVLIMCASIVMSIIALKGHTHIILFLLFLLALPYYTFIFFDALSACAATYYALGLFDNAPISVSHSYTLALQKTRMLIKWMFINTLIKWLVRSKTGNSLRLLSIDWLLNLSWTMVTFFVFPLIATTNNSLIENMKESYTLMKNNFGLNSGALITFSLARGALGRAIFSFCFFGTLCGVFVFNPNAATEYYHFILTVFTTGAHGTIQDFTFIKIILFAGSISIIVSSALMATARTIFKTAVYQHTQGKPSGPFSTQTIATLSA